MSPRKRISGWRRFTPHFRLRPRWTIALTIFVFLAGGLIASGIRPSLGFLLGFDAAALTFLSSTMPMFAGATIEEMRIRAREQDPGRWTALWISVALSVVVLVALGVELRSDSASGLLGIAVAGFSLLLSWLFMNTMFALHYAHACYSDATVEVEALQFPGTKVPDYWDFLYFAMVLGMTFQVSDVQIADHKLRRVALGHSVIAFFFNVIIIAITVNVVAGKA
ncbi:putative membrane protein [Luteibacter rhizovicinus]|uniref:Putative membrane protein n=1 Tax=Luteibacter rhizovicinus TaxID=242606 RepID=A0A4R3YKG6_9GAMM|nr:DUF1345 domain-containing protein [Luteibacter rhizovicinus]TCV93225.1 putative membrane protein [Luteibacter rhizovicinus]